MNEPYNTINYRGFTIEVHQDSDAQNPRTDCDWQGTMVCWHRRYNLGDEQPSCDPQEFMERLACEVDPSVEDKLDYWRNEGWSMHGNEKSDAMIKKHILEALDKHVVMLPLYLYDHSGITMSTGSFSCQWDSGQVGNIYMTREKIRKEQGWKVLTKSRREKIAKYLEGEVETYDQYLTGEVFGFTVVDPDDEDDPIDSCWGYYGDDHRASGLLETAENAIDCHIERNRKGHFEQLKKWIRSKVPVQHRTALESVYQH